METFTRRNEDDLKKNGQISMYNIDVKVSQIKSVSSADVDPSCISSISTEYDGFNITSQYQNTYCFTCILVLHVRLIRVIDPYKLYWLLQIKS